MTLGSVQNLCVPLFQCLLQCPNCLGLSRDVVPAMNPITTEAMEGG